MRFVLKTIWPLYVVCAFTPNKQGIADFFESTSVVHMGYLELDENGQMEQKIAYRLLLL